MRPWYLLFWLTLDYGFHPFFGLVWCGLFIAFGTFAFSLAKSCGAMRPTEKGYSLDCFGEVLDENGKAVTNYPAFNPLIYSIEMFTPVLKLFVAESWLPVATSGVILPHLRVDAGAVTRYYLWLHILAGWLFTTLLVAAFVGILKV